MNNAGQADQVRWVREDEYGVETLVMDDGNERGRESLQPPHIEDLTGRVIRLETALEIAFGAKRGKRPS